jgi:hypothetical protein
LASGINLETVSWVLMGIFVFRFLLFYLFYFLFFIYGFYGFIFLLQVACESLGPLKNGGVVVGIDIKVLFFNSLII